MKKFLSHFFGQGETEEFTNFSLAHFLPILFMIGVIFIIYKFRNKLRDYKHEDRIRLTMSFVMIICEMSYFWRLVGVESLNANPVDHLPITVCGWAIIFCSFLMLTKSQNLFDIVYFWVFAGSIFGLLSPTVITYCGPTRFRYYQFWLEHIMTFISIFYMIFVHGMRPKWKAIIKSFLALTILGIIAIIANKMLPGANYLFMADKTEADAITGFLPSNYAVRIIVMALIVGLLFFIAYLPWLIMDTRKKKITSSTQSVKKSNKKTNKDSGSNRVYLSQNTKENKTTKK